MSTLVAIPENKEIVFGDELRKKVRREVQAKWKNEFVRHFRRDERPANVQSIRMNVSGSDNVVTTTSSILDLHAAIQSLPLNVELDGTSASIVVNDKGDITVTFS
jgi:hypothetical protein